MSGATPGMSKGANNSHAAPVTSAIQFPKIEKRETHDARAAHEIDKYMDQPIEIADTNTNTDANARPSSPLKEVFDSSPEAQAAKDLALLRQFNNKQKVIKARKIVDALKAEQPLDGRLLHTSCIERIFRYNYDNGNIKSSFVSAAGLYARPVEVFRECRTSEANVDILNDIMYEGELMQ